MTLTASTQATEWFFPADVQSAVTEAECRKLWELAQGKTCVELGSWKGRSAIAMAQAARVVHCVDHFQGDEHSGHGSTLQEFFVNVQRYGQMRRIVPHIGSFGQVLPILRGESFDLVFCDGLHTREATLMQVEAAIRLVSDHGGYLAFHDYSEDPALYEAGFRVKEVVDERFVISDLVDTLAIVEY